MIKNIKVLNCFAEIKNLHECAKVYISEGGLKFNIFKYIEFLFIKYKKNGFI